MNFWIKTIKDHIGYVTDVYISDSDHIFGDWHHPISMNILQAEDLFNELEPIIKAYRKWKKKYDKEDH